jgi:hypothetical protein
MQERVHLGSSRCSWTKPARIDFVLACTLGSKQRQASRVRWTGEGLGSPGGQMPEASRLKSRIVEFERLGRLGCYGVAGDQRNHQLQQTADCCETWGLSVSVPERERLHSRGRPLPWLGSSYNCHHGGLRNPTSRAGGPQSSLDIARRLSSAWSCS